MFTGEYKHTIDAKGRVSVPSGMRDVLRVSYDERFVITHSLLGRCLWAFPYEEWQALAERIAKSGLGGRPLMKLRRKLFPNARTCPLDKAGRILLHEPLRMYAEISQEVTFASVGRYVELWRPELWDTEKASLDDDETTDILLTAMAELGL